MSNGQTGFVERVRMMAEAVGSQRALARLSGVTDPAITGWIAGSKPFDSTLQKVSDRTGVSFEWLRDGDGDDREELAKLRRASASPREKLKVARAAAGLTQKELARLISYQLGVVQAVEDGSARISERMAEAISGVLPITKEELMEGSDAPMIIREDGAGGTYGSKPNIRVPAGQKVRYVPLLSWAQAGALGAGHLDEGYDYEGVAAFDIKCKDAFAVEIKGDSMSPQLNEGDRVVVCPSWTPRSGDTVIARTVDGDVYCKLLQRAAGDTLVLVSVNPSHPNIEISRAEVAWIYPVGQVTKNLRRD